ncbi:uncharacterized protein LOC120341954 isoform X2 [Styela clava]
MPDQLMDTPMLYTRFLPPNKKAPSNCEAFARRHPARSLHSRLTQKQVIVMKVRHARQRSSRICRRILHLIQSESDESEEGLSGIQPDLPSDSFLLALMSYLLTVKMINKEGKLILKTWDFMQNIFQFIGDIMMLLYEGCFACMPCPV